MYFMSTCHTDKSGDMLSSPKGPLLIEEGYDTPTGSHLEPSPDDEKVGSKRSRRKAAAAAMAPGAMTTTRKLVRISWDEHTLQEVIAYVKKHRNQVASLDERLTVLYVSAVLRKKHNDNKKKNPGRTYDHAQVIADHVGRSKRLVTDVMSQWSRSKLITVGGNRGNTNPKNTRIPMTKDVISRVLTFVRDQHSEGRRVVARNIMEFLERETIMYVDRTNDKAVASAERNVRNWINANGAMRGERKGTFDTSQRADLDAKRDKYLAFMIGNRDAKLGQRRRVVYMDESYIHEHYALRGDSVYFPQDKTPYVKKKRFKGRRYCFTAALLGPDLNVMPEEKRTDEEKACFLLDVLDIFRGKVQATQMASARAVFPGLGFHKSTDKKANSADYHAMFNHDYFMDWMKKLFEALNARGIKNAIITMDNAKYHCVMPDDVPRSNSPKAVWYAYAKKLFPDKVPDDVNGITVAQLKDLVGQISTETQVQILAREAGHEVVYTPPYHSDLQPIETVWAIVKGAVGRAHTYSTTMIETLERLVAQFQNLSSDTVQSCIDKAAMYEREFWDKVLRAEMHNEARLLAQIEQGQAAEEKAEASSEEDATDDEEEGAGNDG